MAQSVKRLTLAQVMMLWFVSLSPAVGSALTAQSLLQILCCLLSLLLPHSCALSLLLSLSLKNKETLKKKKSSYLLGRAIVKMEFDTYKMYKDVLCR